MIFVLHENLLIILLQKFKLELIINFWILIQIITEQSFLFFKKEAQDWFSGMNIQNSHRHNCIVLDILKHEHHYTVAYLKFKEVIMSKNIEHFVGAKIPNSKTFFNWMLRHNFSVEIVYLYEVRILKSKIPEKFLTFSIALLQIFKWDWSTLHLTQEVFIFNTNYEYWAVYLV